MGRLNLFDELFHAIAGLKSDSEVDCALATKPEEYSLDLRLSCLVLAQQASARIVPACRRGRPPHSVNV